MTRQAAVPARGSLSAALGLFLVGGLQAQVTVDSSTDPVWSVSVDGYMLTVNWTAPREPDNTAYDGQYFVQVQIDTGRGWGNRIDGSPSSTAWTWTPGESRQQPAKYRVRVQTLPEGDHATDQEVAIVVDWVEFYLPDNDASQVDEDGDPTPQPTLTAPSSVNVAVGDGELRVSWTPGTGTSQQVQWKAATSTASWSTSGTLASTASSYTIDRLTNDTAYHVQVCGTDTATTSCVPDPPVAYTPMAPATSTPTLTAPTGVSITAGDEQLSVTWTDGEGASSHKVRYRVANPVGNWTEETTTRKPHVIDNLVNDQDYDVQVGADDGSTTEWSPIRRAAPEAPPIALTPPTDVRVTAGDEQLEVTWTAGNGATSFTLRRREANGGTWRQPFRALGAATTSFTFKGLRNGTTYDVQVRADRDGESTAWVPTPPVQGTPFEPLAGTLAVTVTQEHRALSVSWSGVTGATSYRVEWRVRGTVSAQGSRTLAGTASSHRISPLTAGTEYTVRVTATGGDPSNLSTLVSEANGTPTRSMPAVTAPTNVQLRPGNGDIYVDWTRGNGPPQSWTIHWRETGSGDTWSEIWKATKPDNIWELDNGTTYDVRVGAFDGVQTHWSSIVQGTPMDDQWSVTADEWTITAEWSVTGHIGLLFGYVERDVNGSWQPLVSRRVTGNRWDWTWSAQTPGDFRVTVHSGNSRFLPEWVKVTLPVGTEVGGDCTEDGEYTSGRVAVPVRGRYGYTSCLHDGRFRVTATDLNDDPAPVSHRLRSASGTEDATVMFQLGGSTLLYLNLASYCHLSARGFTHYVADLDTYGESATYELTIEDLEGGTSKVYRSVDSADEVLDVEAFPCSTH